MDWIERAFRIGCADVLGGSLTVLVISVAMERSSGFERSFP